MLPAAPCLRLIDERTFFLTPCQYWIHTARGQRSLLASDRSSVDLAEDDVERADQSRHVGQHVATAEEIHGREMCIARSADLAAIGLVGAVGHQIDADFALRRLAGGANHAGPHVDTLGIQLQPVDTRFPRTSTSP